MDQVNTEEGEVIKKRSCVWDYFKRIGCGKVRCCICWTLISVKNASTSNLLRHVKMMHPTIQFSRPPRASRTQVKNLKREIINDPTDTLLSEGLRSSQSFLVTSQSPSQLSKRTLTLASYARGAMSLERCKELDKRLVNMIVKEYHPFSIVKTEAFKKLIHMLNSEYILPSRKTISSNLVPHLYDTTARVIRKRLLKAIAVTVTIDRWMSVNNESFLALTVHFIDKECVLNSYFLDCFRYEESQTAENISAELKRVLSEWGVLDKVTAAVSDNEATITAAIQVSDWQHIPCFAHSINLVVQAGVQEIKEVETKVKSLVEFLKKNPHALAKLQSFQKKMGLSKLTLKHDVTRWDFTYEMFVRILELKRPVLSTLALVNPELKPLTPREWSIMETSCMILKPFKKVVEEICREKSVAASRIILFSRALIKCTTLIGQNKDLPEEVAEMVRKMLEQLSKEFQDVEENSILAESMLLDPRFKRQGFKEEWTYTNAYESLSQWISCVLITAREDDYEETGTLLLSSLEWEDFNTIVSDLPRNTAEGKIELDNYLKEPLIGRTECPLTWWKSRKSVYPRVFEIMKRRLCVVATAVPCERVFSERGQLLTERRNRLSSDRMSKILFLNANL